MHVTHTTGMLLNVSDPDHMGSLEVAEDWAAAAWAAAAGQQDGPEPRMRPEPRGAARRSAASTGSTRWRPEPLTGVGGIEALPLP